MAAASLQLHCARQSALVALFLLPYEPPPVQPTPSKATHSVSV